MRLLRDSPNPTTGFKWTISEQALKKEIELNLYCDEIKDRIVSDQFSKRQKWTYIGLLIVPFESENALIQSLLNARCERTTKNWADCRLKCNYHPKNDVEVHYTDMQSMDRFHVAKRWIKFLLSDFSLTYFYILGIDLKELDFSRFGSGRRSEINERIYNRFFRMAMQKSVKSYFHQYDRILINSVVHDPSNYQHGDLFPWHCIYRLGRDDEKLAFRNEMIEFLDSDHHKSLDRRSHLLQYIDIILGAAFNALHYASKNENKVILAEKIFPLLDRLMNRPGNVNSRYGYVGRYGIDFFPKSRNFKSEDWPRMQEHLGEFYKTRELKIRRHREPMLFS